MNLRLDPLTLAQTFSCAFFGILFLQSGLDKAFDWKGNLEYLTGHFAKSPLSRMVPMMLATMTIVELAAGANSAAAVLALFIPGFVVLRTVGLGLACLALCMLFFGQRVSKDYEGAVTIATYFGVALLSLYLASLP